ncbi:hypothetical protein V8C34DRAFT_251413 [Trichoderma compactum]
MCYYYYLSFFSALPSNILSNNKAASLPIRLQRPQFDLRLRKEAAKKRLGRGLTGWLMAVCWFVFAAHCFLSPLFYGATTFCAAICVIQLTDSLLFCIVSNAGQDRDFTPRASYIGLPIDLPASPLRHVAARHDVRPASDGLAALLVHSFCFWRLAQLGTSLMRKP